MKQTDNYSIDGIEEQIKIVHLSSAHGDRDVRIFLKECISLAKVYKNLQVHLVLAGVEERIEEGVSIHSVPTNLGGRLNRMWNTVNQVQRKALEIQGDIYHLHDPELLRIALKLKRKGKKVIYDAHEDLPRQIMGKSYLPMKGIISWCVEHFENFVVKKLDGVICATPFIAERFLKINANTTAVNNFPLESEIDFVQNTTAEKANSICYIGGISPIRGIESLVKSIEFTDVKLELAGAIAPEFRVELTKLKGWEKVNELGFIDRQTAMQLKQQSIAGIVTFLPFPNHINAQPNKIFEYMAAGLPVIGSHFPLWKSLIENNNCGICVDPSNPIEIANAINKLVKDKALAKIMGKNGQKLVKEVYNWNAEEKVLIEFYQSLIAK